MYGGLMDVSPRDNEKIKFRIKLSESHFYPLKNRRFGRPFLLLQKGLYNNKLIYSEFYFFIILGLPFYQFSIDILPVRLSKIKTLLI